MIDARAIIMRKAFAAESVGRGENGGHGRYSDNGGERSGEGEGGGREEWSGGVVGVKGERKEDEADGRG